jgi:hypothetical protein
MGFKQGPIPEKMSERPIRNKETWTKCTPLTLLSQNKLALTALFALYNHWSTEKFKNCPRPLFRPRLEPTMHVVKSQIHLARQSL